MCCIGRITWRGNCAICVCGAVGMQEKNIKEERKKKEKETHKNMHCNTDTEKRSKYNIRSTVLCETTRSRVVYSEIFSKHMPGSQRGYTLIAIP